MNLDMYQSKPLGQKLIGIDGKPWLGTDSFLDVSGLDEIHEEIVRGLTLIDQYEFAAGREWSRGDAAEALYDNKYKCVGICEAELTPHELIFFKNLTRSQRFKYLKIAKGGYFPWSYVYQILGFQEWWKKSDAEGQLPKPEALKYFPKLIKWAYSLPIFESIGRIVIFGVDENHHISCHRDSDPETYKTDDELLMLDPNGNKPFYVYDEQKGAKHYVKNSKTWIFHDCDFHGVDAVPYFAYNVRIDGVYTSDFRKKINFGRKC